MAKKKKDGRPTQYRVAYERMAFWMARCGLTNKQIADEFEVAERTLYNWTEKHPKFLQALKQGREEPDRQVEQSLFQRAIGYEYVETDITVDADGTKTTTKHKQKAPDVTAQIFWLKNRKPDDWRDKHEIEGKLDIPLVIQRGDVEA
jgi:hypothetical protein